MLEAERTEVEVRAGGLASGRIYQEKMELIVYVRYLIILRKVLKLKYNLEVN